MAHADGCNNVENDYDGSDCKGGVVDIELKDDNLIQVEDCPINWVGNGHCDPICNTQYHSFDGGDCGAVSASTMPQTAQPTVFSLLDMLTQGSCNPIW
eukprot:COSAG02_NODE_15176_length_1197_cov_1.028233_1_plen_98_part_00